MEAQIDSLIFFRRLFDSNEDYSFFVESVKEDVAVLRLYKNGTSTLHKLVVRLHQCSVMTGVEI